MPSGGAQDRRRVPRRGEDIPGSSGRLPGRVRAVLRGIMAPFGEYLNHEATASVPGSCSSCTVMAEISEQNQMQDSRRKKHALQRQADPGTVPVLPFS